jgi:hypothetical protein
MGKNMGYEMNGLKFKEWQKNNPEKEAERIEKIRKAQLGKIKTIEHRKNLSKTKKQLFQEGKLVSWNKGLTKETDNRIKWKVKKQSLFNCEICDSNQFVELHHKDFNHGNNIKENLIFLCRTCHQSLHRKYLWEHRKVIPIRREDGTFVDIIYMKKDKKLCSQIELRNGGI